MAEDRRAHRVRTPPDSRFQSLNYDYERKFARTTASAMNGVLLSHIGLYGLASLDA